MVKRLSPSQGDPGSQICARSVEMEMGQGKEFGQKTEFTIAEILLKQETSK